jgi:polynucleotide 5'-hydroxyl-kinase GRC3/NOL9
VVPPAWESLAASVLSLGARGRKKVLIIGGVDSGKTTLCRFLLARACGAGIAAGLLDADVGQSTLGPPTTIGAKILRRPEEAFHDDPHPPFLCFVGGTSPSGRICACVMGARKALDWLIDQGAARAVIDTTGLVDGEAGKELKARKIALLDPDLVVGIARANELDPILAPHERLSRTVARLPRSEAAMARSPATRQQFRLGKFQEYFRNSLLHEFSGDALVIADCPVNFADQFDPQRLLTTLPALDRGVLTGLLVGLEDMSGRCIAVGLVEEFDAAGRRLIVRAPYVDKAAVKCLRIGRSGVE